jgi:predicted transcriptional regulator
MRGRYPASRSTSPRGPARVHALIVEGVGSGSAASGSQEWGIVSDAQVALAAASGKLRATAGELAASDAIMISPAEELKHAAELMGEHGVSHLIVSTTLTARPVGIISTLDLAGVLAWGRD